MVASHIKHLLEESDEVIIQDLGAFQATYASAEIHPGTHLFQPPNKNIRFNAKLKISNSLLENHMAFKENISQEEASDYVKQFVSTLKIDLGVHKKYTIDSLGDLLLQANDAVEFKQDRSFNYLDDSFGLPEIYAKPIQRTGSSTVTQTPVKTKTTTTTKPVGKKPSAPAKKPNWGAFIAFGSLGVLSLLVAYVIFINPKANPFRKLLSSSENEGSKKEIVQKEDTTQETTSTEDTALSTNQPETQETTDNNPPENTETVQATQPDPTTPNTTTSNNSTTTSTTSNSLILQGKQNKYFVVLGGFSNVNNAYRFAQTASSRSGENIRIIPPFDSKRLYRVVVADFGSKDKADLKIEDLKGSFGSDIWVLQY